MAKRLYNVRAYSDTTDNWAANTHIYPSNSLLIDTETGAIKKGDGVKTYAQLGSLGVKQALAWGDVTGIPAALTSAQAAETASIRAIGTTATTAAAGNHDHAVVEDEESGLEAAATIQDLAEALSERILALETAAAGGGEEG